MFEHMLLYRDQRAHNKHCEIVEQWVQYSVNKFPSQHGICSVGILSLNPPESIIIRLIVRARFYGIKGLCN